MVKAKQIMNTVDYKNRESVNARSKMGSFWSLSGSTYMLCMVAPFRWALIDLESGNRAFASFSESIEDATRGASLISNSAKITVEFSNN